MKDDDLRGKTALVTGASGGVGFRVAEKLAARGACVIINARTQDKAESALASLRALSPDAAYVLGDCGDYATATRVVQEAAALGGGRLDILVSAGAQGVVSPMPFAEMTGEQLVTAFETRMFARIFPVHAAVPLLREHGGAVVMLGTDAGRHPTPGESVMGAVGAGVILMTKTLAKEFSRWSIRVNTVAMTLTSDTPSWERIFGGEDAFQSKLFTKLSEKFPAGRPPTSEEIARVVVFLATDESAQVTGQTISANGGLSFGGW